MKKVAICKFEDLIGEEDAISVKTMLKIEKLKKDKYLLIVHSKKKTEDILYYNRDFPFIDYIINEKGYYTYDVKKKKKIINKNINKQIINRIHKMYYNKPIIFIGENGIIKDNKIIKEKIYEINVYDDDEQLTNLSIKINKDNKKITISKEELSLKNMIKEICIKLKINENNIIQLTRTKLNELD